MNQRSFQPEPDPVGAEYGGKWVAWDDRALRIVASGETMEEVREWALAAGVKMPDLEFVPPADRAFVAAL
jgi:hypothetical protein